MSAAAAESPAAMRVRGTALLVAAMALVALVLGVQLANGGADFVPRTPADPCAERTVTSVGTGLDALTEQIVLLGLDGAACQLHISRERLVLTLADPQQRDTLDPETLRAGLLKAVQRLDSEDRLPPVSDYVDEALDASDLSGFIKTAIRALPDSVIDKALPTAPLLTRAITDLDISALLDRLDDPAELNSLLQDAILDAAKDEILDRIPKPF